MLSQRQQNVPHILAGLSIAFLIKIYKKFIKSEATSDLPLDSDETWKKNLTESKTKCF